MATTEKLYTMNVPQKLLKRFQLHCRKYHSDAATVIRSYMQERVDDSDTPIVAHLDMVKTFFQKVEQGETVKIQEIVDISRILEIQPESLMDLVDKAEVNT